MTIMVKDRIEEPFRNFWEVSRSFRDLRSLFYRISLGFKRAIKVRGSCDKSGSAITGQAGLQVDRGRCEHSTENSLDSRQLTLTLSNR
jgi:hypothetical protein